MALFCPRIWILQERGHFEELKTSEARYEDLLGEAGYCYSSYLKPLHGG
ncbi:MAG: hypothetical protein LM569_04765 [Desulfurococcaceae archaeon]|nr:hypothetical protein [Desulfurococcaceae archaeon]